MEVQAGQHVEGHKLLSRIGQGHYGEIWKAEYGGQTVALKIFTRYHKIHPESLRREVFAQYALGKLEGDEGKYFPRVEHVSLESRPPWMRMDFIDGRPLDLMVEDPDLSLEARLDLGLNILRALAVVHGKGYVHGDLSPMNVLVRGGEVRLIDVGFGAIFDEGAQDIVSSATAEEQPLGVASPMYAAPERFRAEFLDGCGKASDIFAFGKVLYRLIAGETPFVIKPVSMRFKALGREWDDFLFRCLEEKPEDRFPDAPTALVEFLRIYRPKAVEGEYRAECPECRTAARIPGGWAGERFSCLGCAHTLEVLFYDEESSYAATAIVNDYRGEDHPDIQFLDDVADDRARKFCPVCGDAMEVSADRCGECAANVDEQARKIVVREIRNRNRSREPEAAAERNSYAVEAILTFFAYFLLWLPGALLNWIFLERARAETRRTGREPAAMPFLQVMIWLFVYLPLVGLAGLIMVAIIGSGLRLLAH